MSRPSNLEVSHLSTHDAARGAGRGAFRVHKALLTAGVRSRFIVQQVTANTPSVEAGGLFTGACYTRYRLLRDQLSTFPYGSPWKRAMFSTGQGGPNKRIVEQCKTSDVIHLHWICKGFVPTKTLSDFRAPIVWSLRDMWPLTGGCHYNSGCEKFATECGSCPVLGSQRHDDLAQRVFHEKRLTYRQIDLTFVALNRWMADVARSSVLAQGHLVRIIPNAIERTVFLPGDGREERKALGIWSDATVIAFAAMGGTKDPRKGFDILKAAIPELLQVLPGRHLCLLIIGEKKVENVLDGIPTFWAGHVDSETRMVQLLNAADVFAAPSRQDNLPNTVAEALACGLPSVAFDVGGIPDLIQHKKNGYLAKPFCAGDFARGIHWTLADDARLVLLKQAARDSTARLDPSAVAAQHVALYEELLSRRTYFASA